MKNCPRCGMRFPDTVDVCMIHEGETLVPFLDTRLGTTLNGRYHLRRVVGEGGMATVYEATQTGSQRVVAVKVLNGALLNDQKMVERFRREAKHCARLTHPNIVEVIDYDQSAEGVPYMVMELLVGEPLSSRIDKGPAHLDFALPVLVQVTRALARAHDLKIVHRDLKPENVFLPTTSEPMPVVKVIDFGIARALGDGRLTAQGELFGTPQYMSPGRIKGLDTTPSDDLYALGVMMFELVTGQLPFEATDIGTFFMKHLTERAPDPRQFGVPEGLATLIEKLLAKQEKDRPVDAHSVERDLLAISTARALHVPRTTDFEVSAGPVTLSARASTLSTCVPLVEQLLTLAFGDVAMADSSTLTALETLRTKVTLLSHAEAESWKLDAELLELERVGREARSQLGFALDALGHDASRARQAVRDLEQTREASNREETKLQQEFIVLHRDLLQLEGRFAFQSPTAALAEAYREAATVLDTWREHGLKLREIDEQLDAAMQAVKDLDYQVEKLRGVLSSQEESYEAKHQEVAARLATSASVRDSLAAAVRTHLDELVKPHSSEVRLLPIVQELNAVLKGTPQQTQSSS